MGSTRNQPKTKSTWKTQDNGAHERLHRDISQELECLGKSVSQEALDLWRPQFNYQRPHAALDMRCPGELYHNSTRKYAGGVQELLYDDMIVRRVNDSGCIHFKDQSLFISQSLSGWKLGLKSTQNQKTQLWFAQLLLGHLDPATLSFERIDLNPFDAKTNFKSAA